MFSQGWLLVFACWIGGDCLFLRHQLIKGTCMKKKVLSVHILMVGNCARVVEWKCNGLP
jgi:hypothetical protein